MRRFFTSRLAAALVGAAAMAAIGSVAWAVIPDSNGAIHGCRSTKSGALRVIDAPSQSCKSTETPLDWNQQGPQGNPGVPGPSGVSGYEVVKVVTPLDAMSTQSADAYCSVGKRVLGGGADVTFAPGITLNASYPQIASSPTGVDGWTGVASIEQQGKLWNIKGVGVLRRRDSIE